MFLIDGFFSERTVIANQKRTGRKHYRAFELSTGTTRSGHDHFCSRAIEFGNYNCVGGSKWTKRSVSRRASPRALSSTTSWFDAKTDITGEQVPLNELKLAIARWKAGEKTNSSMIRTERKKLIFIYI